MLAFVPISLACKGNTKCQTKFSSNNRIITAAPGTAGGMAWSFPSNKTSTQRSVAFLMRWQRSRNKVQTLQEYVNCAATADWILAWCSLKMSVWCRECVFNRLCYITSCLGCNFPFKWDSHKSKSGFYNHSFTESMKISLSGMRVSHTTTIIPAVTGPLIRQMRRILISSLFYLLWHCNLGILFEVCWASLTAK